MPTRRCWVEVDGRALLRNYRILRGLIPKITRLLAVVKANAYGHGLVPVGRELEALGADWLGVANAAEGKSLRDAGVRIPILLLSATLPFEMEDALKYDLTATISDLKEARLLARVAANLQCRARVHFKIDTGMGRLGHWHAEAVEELIQLRRVPNMEVTGLCTHFSSADDNAGLTQKQWKLIEPFFAANADLLRHAANSPAVTRGYGYDADMVRAGLALYGVAPNPADQKLGLQPVMMWKTRVCLLRQVGAGRTVSYGATYRLRKAERHATVGMGYGDGFFRLHSNHGHMLVRGVRCPIRGRVTMDQIILDVSRVLDCQVGDEVVALGRQRDEEITAWELAKDAQTIPWEIFTNVGARVPRIYRNFKTQSSEP